MKAQCNKYLTNIELIKFSNKMISFSFDTYDTHEQNTYLINFRTNHSVEILLLSRNRDVNRNFYESGRHCRFHSWFSDGECFLKPADEMLRQLVCSHCHCLYDVVTLCVCYDNILNSCFFPDYFEHFHKSCPTSTNIT